MYCPKFRFLCGCLAVFTILGEIVDMKILGGWFGMEIAGFDCWCKYMVSNKVADLNLFQIVALG